jgi:hypothetical protein
MRLITNALGQTQNPPAAPLSPDHTEVLAALQTDRQLEGSLRPWWVDKAGCAVPSEQK